ncbi:MAG: hypothetical protein ACYCPQ_00900 [Elusimicrobiota bacterium]
MPRLLLAAGMVFFSAAPVRAAFEDSGFSARAVAMGGAFTGVAGDPASVFYNPAGISFLRHSAMSLNSLNEFNLPAGAANESQTNAAAIIPLGFGSLGLSGIYTAPRGLSPERTAQLTYATKDLWQAPGTDFEMGGSLKYLSAAPTASGASKGAPALDLGAMERFHEKYSAGLSILNLAQAKAGGVAPPVEFRAGLAESVRGMTFDVDAWHESVSGIYPEETSVGAGFERWWETIRWGSFAARAGLRAGDRDKTWNMGIGWKVMGGEADYAVTIPLQGAAQIGNAVSMSWRFGASHPNQEFARMLETESGYRKILTQELQDSANREWELSQRLESLRAEIKALGGQLLDRTISEAEARKRLGDLERQYQDSLDRFQRIQDKERAIKAKAREKENSPQVLLEKDWQAYLELKRQGAADAVLIEDLKRILRQYQDSGADLSSANQELLRLLQSR